MVVVATAVVVVVVVVVHLVIFSVQSHHLMLASLHGTFMYETIPFDLQATPLTDRQTSRQAGRQAGRQTHRHTDQSVSPISQSVKALTRALCARI